MEKQGRVFVPISKQVGYSLLRDFFVIYPDMEYITIDTEWAGIFPPAEADPAISFRK
jgi:hypothetical protein